MPQSNNPLQQFFRRPAIYVQLPSEGQFWPPGSLDLPPNKELPVFPMTAIDEITYRTPDGLFNGAATVSVLQSCVPNIKNAWHTPLLDLNTLLIGMRIATSGHNLDIDSNCPECKEENSFQLDLRQVMQQQTTPNYSESLQHNDLEIYFRPISYQNQNKISIEQFNQQRVLNSLADSTEDEEVKTQQLNQALKSITEVTIEAMKYSINGIKTPSAFVSEPEFIEEFLKNCDRSLFNQIRDHVVKLREQSDLKPLKMTCQHCQHSYEQDLTMDSSSFFGQAS